MSPSAPHKILIDYSMEGVLYIRMEEEFNNILKEW